MSGALAIFATLIGHCYAAEVAPGAVDRHCFSAPYAGAHVRDIHEVRAGGKVVYSGETFYSDSGAGLVFTYFNSLGGVGHGKATVGTKTLQYSGSMVASPGKAPIAVAGHWMLRADGYATVTDGQPMRHFRRAK